MVAVSHSLAWSQTTTENYPEEQPGLIREALTKHHIQLNKESLVEALRNENPSIRWLAAAELSDEGARDAIPDLVSAMQVETVPESRLSIAYALAWLGVMTGVSTVRSVCETNGASTGLRLRAVKYLIDLGKDGCVDAVLQIVGSELDVTPEALSILPRLRHVSQKQNQQISQAARLALVNNDLLITTVAVRVLVKIRDVSAIPEIIAAKERESDGSTRNQMEAAIKALQLTK